MSIDKKLPSMANVKSVKQGYDYWLRLLISKATGIFNYENLPTTIDKNLLEQSIIWNGWAPIINHSKYGILCPTQGLFSAGAVSGYDINQHPITYTMANPCIIGGPYSIEPYCEMQGTLPPFKDKCTVIFNSTIDSIMMPYPQQGIRNLLCRYARMLADIESSINIATINTRLSSTVSAQTNAAAKTIEEALNKIQEGNYSVITLNNIMENIKPIFDKSSGGPTDIQSLYDLREKLLCSFYEEIGVNKIQEKKERMITDETTNPQLLLTNLEDMLEARKKGIEYTNFLFGTNITVSIKNEYNPAEYNPEDTETEGDDDNENI